MTGLSFQGVTKSFGAVRALKGVTFPVEEGEAHALVGENGAGKSTLMRVLAGIVRPDGGQLVWDGRKLELHSPRAALDQGIGMVYQEMLLFPNLTVSGNIFAGREVTGRGGRLREPEMRAPRACSRSCISPSLPTPRSRPSASPTSSSSRSRAPWPSSAASSSSTSPPPASPTRRPRTFSRSSTGCSGAASR